MLFGHVLLFQHTAEHAALQGLTQQAPLCKQRCRQSDVAVMLGSAVVALLQLQLQICAVGQQSQCSEGGKEHLKNMMADSRRDRDSTPAATMPAINSRF